MIQPRQPSGSAPDVAGLSIGILGGTGDEGRGLALRFAHAGHSVIIGSRSLERACAAAAGLGAELGIRGMENAAAARDRKSTRLNSSHRCISYAVFCLKKKKQTTT